MRIDGPGFTIDLPQAWTGAVVQDKHPDVVGPPVLQAANFPFSPKAGDTFLSTIWDSMPESGVIVSLLALPDEPGYAARDNNFDDLVPPLTLRPTDFFDWYEGIPASMRVARRFFRFNGRAFHLVVLFATSKPPIRVYADVNAVLTSFSVN